MYKGKQKVLLVLVIVVIVYYISFIPTKSKTIKQAKVPYHSPTNIQHIEYDLIKLRNRFTSNGSLSKRAYSITDNLPRVNQKETDDNSVVYQINKTEIADVGTISVINSKNNNVLLHKPNGNDGRESLNNQTSKPSLLNISGYNGQKSIDSGQTTGKDTTIPVGRLLQNSLGTKQIINENNITIRSLCTNYSIYQTQYIQGVWQSSRESLQIDKKGNSAGKDYRAFSAYYDDRRINQNVIWIVGSASWDVGSGQDKGLYCTLWYKDGSKYTSRVSLANIKQRNRILPINSISTCQTDIRCPVYGNEKPSHISISFEPCVLSMKLPVVYPSGRPPGQAVVCTPPIYDRIPSKEAIPTIEWVELYRHFGVNKFYIYSVGTVFDPPVQKVFDYYSSIGVINLISIPPVAANTTGLSPFRLSKTISKHSFDDCLFRNMYEHDYVLTVDMDDIMIPREYNNFKSLVDAYRANETRQFSSYNVQSVNYFLDYGPTLKNSDPLITSRYFYNSGIGTINNRAKTKPIIDPQRCLFMWNHYCQTPFSKWYSTAHLQKPAIMSHHYRRSCAASYSGEQDSDGMRIVDRSRVHHCDENLDKGKTDSYTLQFRDHLLSKVNQLAQKLDLDIHNHY